jgi:hypothetical protein
LVGFSVSAGGPQRVHDWPTGFLVVDVTPVTHAAGGAVKLGNNMVDPGFMVDSEVYVPPDPPHSPDQPR